MIGIKNINFTTKPSNWDFNSSIKNYKKFLDVKDKSQIKTELALSRVSRNNKKVKLG